MHVSVSLKVGPPRNVTVEQTDEGDEFVVSWYPPEYGLEFLRVYVVNKNNNLIYNSIIYSVPKLSIFLLLLINFVRHCFFVKFFSNCGLFLGAMVLRARP